MSKNINKSITINEVFLFVFIFMKSWSDTSLYTNYTYSKSLSVMLIMIYIVFLSLIFFRYKSSKYEFLVTMVMGLMLLVPFLHNHKALLIINFLGIIFCRKCKFEHIVKAVLWAQILSVISIVLCNMAGILPTVEKFRNGTLRYSLGFRHANNAGTYLLSILLLFIIDKYDKWKKRDYIIIISVQIIILFTCKSRTSLICCILAGLLLLISKLIGFSIIDNKLIKGILIVSAPILIFCTYYFGIHYMDYRWIQTLNKLATDRFYINWQYFENYQISLLGHKNVALENWYLDSSYSNLLLSNGLLSSFVYMIIMVISMKKSIECKKIPIVISLLIWEIYGLFETGSLFFWFNIGMLFVLSPIYKTEAAEGDSNATGIFNNCT